MLGMVLATLILNSSIQYGIVSDPYNHCAITLHNDAILKNAQIKSKSVCIAKNAKNVKLVGNTFGRGHYYDNNKDGRGIKFN